jgi:predicted 2-oxoglutarate/Fe(II)-dependent dioxygenase YbiX
MLLQIPDILGTDELQAVRTQLAGARWESTAAKPPGTQARR